MLLLLAIGCAGYFIVKRRVAAIRQKSALDKQIADYELKALHAQMNPHFLFNCLNSIKEMIVTGDRNGASRYLNQFAHLIRDTLEESKLTFVSLKQTTTYITSYIKMEQLRFNDFKWEVTVDKTINVNEVMLPPMLIQPLVENAVWHGLRRKKGNKELVVNFARESNMLVCRIKDNGIGISRSLAEKKDAHHISNGVDNIRKRLTLLNEKYDLNAHLVINDLSTTVTGGGTEAVLSLLIDIDDL